MDILRRFISLLQRAAGLVFLIIDLAVTVLSKNSVRTIRTLKNIFRIKLYDCITFSDGLDILEIRLNVLDPYVDFFVIVEATKSHAGKPTPLYFQENSNRYAKFKEKIIHVVVEDMPDLSENMTRHGLAAYQRNQIKRGLTNCRDSDIIFISDMDEIPNPKKIASMIVLLNTFWKILFFRQSMYYYYLNGMLTPSVWDLGTVSCKFSTFVRQYQAKADRIRPSWMTSERSAIPLLREGG